MSTVGFSCRMVAFLEPHHGSGTTRSTQHIAGFGVSEALAPCLRSSCLPWTIPMGCLCALGDLLRCDAAPTRVSAPRMLGFTGRSPSLSLTTAPAPGGERRSASLRFAPRQEVGDAPLRSAPGGGRRSASLRASDIGLWRVEMHPHCMLEAVLPPLDNSPCVSMQSRGPPLSWCLTSGMFFEVDGMSAPRVLRSTVRWLPSHRRCI